MADATPRCCPDDVAGNCRQREAACWYCAWPEDAKVPTQYLPIDRAAKIPAIEARKQALAAQRHTDKQAAKQTDASRRGRANRRKGQRVERDFAKLTGGQRVPLSGALRGSLSNDVALPDGLKVEIKSRATGFKTLYDWILDDVEKPDALVLKADNKPFLVVQTYENWQAGRQPAPVDLKKLAEARRLLEEALE